jgi:hypothetical protein
MEWVQPDIPVIQSVFLSDHKDWGTVVSASAVIVGGMG